MVRKAEKSWAYAEEINEKTSAEKVTWDQEKGNGGGRVLDGEEKVSQQTYEKSMSTKQYLGLIASILLLIGVFVPIVSVPFVGDMNYFQNGKGDGVFILILAIVSLISIFAKKYKALWFTGPGSLAILIFTFSNFQVRMADVKKQMELELADNPFRDLADIALQSVQLQWGWALLIVGSVLLIVSAAMKDKVTK
ncbi:hypothetical protein [Acetomicrobium sp.]|jgi:nitrate reductase NapE component|uniref:hypothetical protein n=1 Tax=Acetomicrobium sp. TaxID=1872099 RepID=UPI00287152CD|nr:hypothetical protein [Acetomicrobium sp.]MDR9770181.1 hypothetical protein [Acetomicrobium sp.]